VIGAGIGGLAAAAAASKHFSQVVVFERDDLVNNVEHRPGSPQGRHLHVLLGGGLRALEKLLPGFGEDLSASGAVKYRVGLETRTERLGFDPFPQRDLGWHSFAMSRPLLESILLRRVARHANVEFRCQCTVRSVETDDHRRIVGVWFENGGRKAEFQQADLVIDASARGALTLECLRANGFECPLEATIGVDIGYSTATFKIPRNVPVDWKTVVTLPDPRVIGFAGALAPLEGDRWIVSIGAAHRKKLPIDPEGFMRCLQNLRTSTIFRAVSDAERAGSVARYCFSESVRRDFEHLDRFPIGLLPIADAICRLNPIYGQGMSVAAIEACYLKEGLGALTEEADPLAHVTRPFFRRVALLLDSPWSVANMDFVYPQTRGIRPAGFHSTLRFIGAINRLSARDPTVHKLMMEVQHLLRTSDSYREAAMAEQISAEMACA
jgi:2-polyprenyl-6-methoxyphenol hydroxylase-like FAD-dependent oxidoreductase